MPLGVGKVNGVLEGSGRGVAEEDFTETADANGVITIAFTHGANSPPMVNAIAVVPSS